jgi:hypothetical protein
MNLAPLFLAMREEVELEDPWRNTLMSLGDTARGVFDFLQSADWFRELRVTSLEGFAYQRADGLFTVPVEAFEAVFAGFVTAPEAPRSRNPIEAASLEAGRFWCFPSRPASGWPPSGQDHFSVYRLVEVENVLVLQTISIESDRRTDPARYIDEADKCGKAPYGSTLECVPTGCKGHCYGVKLPGEAGAVELHCLCSS